ncbi:DUF3017 domain-containing protein [Streptomyces sp. NPDC001795]|uniref:DUF3017 domain-containing protein n=1 Tax=Streptomyces sp. NPDC001795 TaxID=3154525 RepID=UPI0033202FAE
MSAEDRPEATRDKGRSAQRATEPRAARPQGVQPTRAGRPQGSGSRPAAKQGTAAEPAEPGAGAVQAAGRGANAAAAGPGGRGTSTADRSAADEPTAPDAHSAPDDEDGPQGAPLSRRFPRITQDTARPEGGGRAAPRGAPAPARQWPILAVLAVVGVGLLVTALDAFRFGTILIGVALMAGAVMRWVLPDVGMLAVRSRFTDMITYGVLGVAIVLLAMMAQPNPWLEIPFLDDTLHFTIRT